MAKAKLMPIAELIGKNFFIPSYQRGFKWTTTQMKELLQDLYVFSKEWKATGDYYCLQPIIVKWKEEDKVWEVVDGQQRLTAIWMLYTLYYLSRKRQFKKAGIERESFSLMYQKKESFTELFEIIGKYVDGDGKFDEISEDLQNEKMRGVDALNLIENIEYITNEFSYMGDFADNALAFILARKNDIDIIWYELEDENPIQTFANINANKIDLTNAELLKALLLHSRVQGDDLQTMALQWDSMEKGLRDSHFWNFLVNVKAREKSRMPEYSTHVDLLFEIWCAKEGIKLYQGLHDRHAIFREISKQFDECSGEVDRDKKAKKIWVEILQIYETLTDWYEDDNLYHKIGLLLAVNSDNKTKQIDNSELIKDFYTYYECHTRDEFAKELIRKITRDVYGFNADSLAGVLSTDVEDSLDEVGYDDKEKVKRILLLYNISLLVNASNQHERFPFDLYNKDIWDVEHVNPQTPLELKEEEVIAYLRSYMRFLIDWNDNEADQEKKQKISEVIDLISACISDKTHGGFKDANESIAQICEIENNDNIQNLVLLDAETNRGYKNACFFDKRKCIIAKEKNNSKVGIDDLEDVKLKYIPIGTKCVFLKGFDSAREMIIWGATDRKAYQHDIAVNITKMLGGVVKDAE